MGVGIEIGCKCNKKEYMLGVGMMFPSVYKDTVQNAKDGKFGKTIQTLMQQNEYAVMDVGNTLYYCDKCGHIESNDPLDIYIAKDVESFKKKEYGIKTVEEWGEVPYWSVPSEEDDEYNDFIKIYTHTHKCPTCKIEMKSVTPEYLENTPCPKCGEKHEILDNMLWD